VTKKHYVLIGLVALVVTLLGTTALIMAARSAFVGTANQEANPYNSLPVGKVLSQTTNMDAKSIKQWSANRASAEKGSQLASQADLMLQNKQYQQAVDTYAKSLACLEQYPGLGSMLATEVLTRKAKCEDKLGLDAEREKTLRTLVDASAAAYNESHEQVAAALESLGALLCDKNRQREALPLIERAMDIRVKGAGLDSGDTAYTISQLAHCQLDLKNYKQADDLYQKAIAIYEKLDGDGFSESQQIARENLANSYRWQSRYKDAMASEVNLIYELEKKNLGNSRYMANTLTAAASTAQSQKDRAKMQEFLSRAEKIAIDCGPTFSNQAAEIYSDIADTYDEDDDFKNELPARQSSIGLYLKLKYPQPEEQEQLAVNLVKAGACALKLKDYRKAQEYYGEALTQARDNQDIRLKLKANKGQIEEYLRYIEKDRRAGQDATMKMQATELKQMLVG
jgi:tetratricopeptide (TPR) repeat protein